MRFVWLLSWLAISISTIVTTYADTAVDKVGKWRRHVITLHHSGGYSGNPFELEVDASFTHVETGTILNLPGFYAGNETWKVAFMPPLTGEWTYVTSSLARELHGVTGTIMSVESDHPGMLKADKTHPKKWKYVDGSYVVPIGLLYSVFLEEASATDFVESADFLKNGVGGHLFGFRLTNQVFIGDWRDYRFDLSLWDRLDERMEILTDRGLGINVMLYADGKGKPPWRGQSTAERLLIRYTVARLAAYPTVWFNTGIDIGEYRDREWIHWYGSQLRALDPYGHPLSSRHGGGSGNTVMVGQLHNSKGAKLAKVKKLMRDYENADVPVSMDDNWGERFGRGNFSPTDIRRAIWKNVVAGGIAGHIRDDNKSDPAGANDPDGWFRTIDMKDELESEQWLVLINPMLDSKLGSTFGAMAPAPSLVSNGFAIADPAVTKILILLLGQNDQFDRGDGGQATVRLSGVRGDYSAEFFDPRTGDVTRLEKLSGGTEHVITPPSADDWVLLLELEETP